MWYIQKLASTGADTVDGGSAKEKPTSEIDEAVSSLPNVVTDANVDLSLQKASTDKLDSPKEKKSEIVASPEETNKVAS